MQQSLDTRRRRLYYRSWHRGCKETDVILGYFADHALASLPEQDLDLYEALLDEQDIDIWNWLTGSASLKGGAYDLLLPRLKEYTVAPV